MKDWEKKQREFEQVKARAKELRLRLTCTICGEKAKLNCPCRTTQYCSTECQRIDWRDRGHRKACKKIRDERAAEAARAEAPTPPPPEEVVFYGPAPRSHADEVRARIAAEHEAARARREANPEPQPLSARFGSRCPICMEEWDVDEKIMTRPCCYRRICISCEDKIPIEAPCPLCQAPYPRTDAEHLALIRRHAENEVPEAVYELGDLYWFGEDYANDIVKSTKKAVKLFKRAVELGNVEAMVALGRSYFLGEGVKKIDKSKAMQYYRMAVDRGHAGAQNTYAVLLKKEKRYAEAVRYYRLAAEQGHTTASFNLGVAYAKGVVVEADLDEAKRWYARAADRGYAAAQNNLGALLDEEERFAEAARYYRLAAEQGNADASVNLGVLYENGDGVERDLDKAKRWYARAAAKGHKHAIEALEALNA
jgi:TPR repeat protein